MVTRGTFTKVYLRISGWLIFCLFYSNLDRPRVIETLRGKDVVDIACGGAHSAAITARGELYTWGKGRYGRLGHGDGEDQLRPKLVRLVNKERRVLVGRVSKIFGYSKAFSSFRLMR